MEPVERVPPEGRGQPDVDPVPAAGRTRGVPQLIRVQPDGPPSRARPLVPFPAVHGVHALGPHGRVPVPARRRLVQRASGQRRPLVVRGPGQLRAAPHERHAPVIVQPDRPANRGRPQPVPVDQPVNYVQVPATGPKRADTNGFYFYPQCLFYENTASRKIPFLSKLASTFRRSSNVEMRVVLQRFLPFIFNEFFLKKKKPFFLNSKRSLDDCPIRRRPFGTTVVRTRMDPHPCSDTRKFRRPERFSPISRPDHGPTYT